MNRFTNDQLSEFRNAFCTYDKEKMGFILSTDLRKVLMSLGFNPNDKDLQNLTIVVDLDNDGLISFDEFIDLIDKLETEKKNLMSGLCFIFFFFFFSFSCWKRQVNDENFLNSPIHSLYSILDDL